MENITILWDIGAIIEVIGAFGANLQLFSFSGSDRLLHSSTQPWESIIEKANWFQ